jgi:CRP/FNR family nitrogen fixation transcriptional regulator
MEAPMSAAYLTEARIVFPDFPRPEAAVGRDPLGMKGVRVSYGRGEEIYGEQEPAEFVYRLVSGVVRTCKNLSDGRRQIADFLLPGEVFGLETGEEHALSAEAVGDAVVCAMRRRILVERAGHDCELARRLWVMSLRDLNRSQAHMLLLGRKGALERLAWFLLDMGRRLPVGEELLLPMSRQDIADYLGLTIETVSRAITQLIEDGLIELNGCRRVTLSDRAALEALAQA